jgi:hypothetical protein
MNKYDLLALTKSVAIGAACLWVWVMLVGMFRGSLPDAIFHYIFGLVECVCCSIGVYQEEKL